MQLCKIKESHYYYCLELQDQQGLTPNLVTYSIPRANSIWMLAKGSGDFDSAKKLFDKMPERNSVTWTLMITRYSQMGSRKKAVEYLVDMYAKRAEDGSMVNPRKVFDLIPASSVIYGLRLSQVVGRVEGIVKEVIELYFRIH
ncbi:hypothetical protein C3L33_03911, partial [Rhododendron williamsianum]